MSALQRTLAGLNKIRAHSIANYTHSKRLASGCGSKTPVPNPNYSKRMVKLKKLQEHFQRDDGKPIFLKRGAADRALYLSTVGLGVLGLILTLKFYASYITDDK